MGSWRLQEGEQYQTVEVAGGGTIEDGGGSWKCNYTVRWRELEVDLYRTVEVAGSGTIPDGGDSWRWNYTGR